MNTPRDPPSSSTPEGTDRLDSWKEIALYLNRDVRTVQRWEETSGLPVRRRVHDGLKKGPVYAYRSELDTWLRLNFPASRGTLKEPAPAVRPARRLWLLSAGLCVLFLLAGFALWRFWPREPLRLPPRVVQLTNYPGVEQHPAFSPDGKQLAFSWNGKDQNNFDIYARFLDTGAPLRLTSHPARDWWPAWSPDGRFIAFLRLSRIEPKADALVVPALGGAERKIGECPRLSDVGPVAPALCWTADGSGVILPHRGSPGAPVSLAIVYMASLESRPLTTPPAGSAGDCCPALSPDGDTLAFLRATAGGAWHIHLLRVGRDGRPQGEPRRLTVESTGVLGPMWGENGQQVLYLASQRGAWALWRVPADGSHSPRPIESLAPIGTDWAASRSGDLLAFSNSTSHAEIWRMALGDSSKVSRLISSSGARDFNPQYSPDGKRIAFVSAGPQGVGVWVADSEGNNPVQVAATTGIFAAPPRWSPDSRRIVFECVQEGNEDICAVPADGGGVRRITRHPAQDLLPSWSSDGRWIYMTSDRSGSPQIWKTPATGEEARAAQLTRNGGFGPVESPNGAVVYYAKERRAGALSQVPAAGGQEGPVGSIRLLGRAQSFAVTKQGIYYPSSTIPEQWFEIWQYPFASGRPMLIGRVEKRLASGLSISPDGRWLLFPAFEEQFGDIYMVEDFR